MLVLLVATTVLGSLAVEWMLNRAAGGDELPELPRLPLARMRQTPVCHPVAGRRDKPMTLRKAERQMNGAFNDASDEIGLS